jgi:hypothetical protein
MAAKNGFMKLIIILIAALIIYGLIVNSDNKNKTEK